MKKFLFLLLMLFLLLFRWQGKEVWAQGEKDNSEATVAAEINISSPSAQIEEIAKKDITERTSPVRGKLEGYLAEKTLKPLGLSNFLQYAIRQAVNQGVSANTIVLVLLLPSVAGLIAVARHLLGLTGFGIFIPAILAVAFLATGIKVGITMFVIIWLVATISQNLTKKMKLQYLPRLAILMWFISLGVLIVLLAGVNIGFEEISAISIFPILILMLLMENFIEVQVGKSRREAIKVTAQTLTMAVVASVILSLDSVQKFALLNPEISLLLVAVLDIYIGKYAGLRVLEIFKFRKLLK